MSLDMNPEIRAQWCAALRSGDYAQADGYLHRATGACCLGVLCDLAVKAKVIGEPVDCGGFWSFEGNAHFLPAAVMTWAGIRENDPVVYGAGALSNLNDDGTPFAEIADLIDGGAS